jgi:hypothetical protein
VLDVNGHVGDITRARPSARWGYPQGAGPRLT